MTSKERCMAVLAGRSADRTPVFPLLMFFAQERAGITYREYASNGRALADAQLNMRDRFAVDAITVCSDAFRVTADLGAEMAYPEDKPPFAVRPLVANEAELRRLAKPDPLAAGSRMADRVDAARIVADAVGDECLTLGWVDMPFAEACAVCGVTDFMMLMVDEPSLAHAILDFLTEIVIDFGLAQFEAGVPMIGAGDAAASLVSPAHYREFALPYEQRVIERIHDAGGLVKLHICGNTAHILQDMIRCGADLFNVDHLVGFDLACRAYGEAGKAFKGNLDPVGDVLYATPQECAARCAGLLEEASGLRYMVSAGCEIPADVEDAVFEAFCNAPQRM